MEYLLSLTFRAHFNGNVFTSNQSQLYFSMALLAVKMFPQLTNDNIVESLVQGMFSMSPPFTSCQMGRLYF